MVFSMFEQTVVRTTVIKNGGRRRVWRRVQCRVPRLDIVAYINLYAFLPSVNHVDIKH